MPDRIDAGRQRVIAAVAREGADFYVIGENEVLVKMPNGSPAPAGLLDTASQEALYRHLVGDEEADALEFSARLGCQSAVLRTDADCDAGIREINKSKHEFKGLDTETMTPGLPDPVKVNMDGRRAVERKHRDELQPAATDPHQAGIATIQIFPGDDTAFVFVGDAKERLLRQAAPWLCRQRLFAHNAAFDTKFFLHAGLRFVHPIECTMLMAQLAYGPAARSLAMTTHRMFGVTPPKTLGGSYWGGLNFRKGQIAYAAVDAILPWMAGSYMRPRILNGRLRVSYELQRNAIPAVAAMELRGLGLDIDAHTRQIAEWKTGRAEAETQYLAELGNPPPSTPAQIGRLIEGLLDERQLAEWPRTEKTNQLSTAWAHLKLLSGHREVALLIDILTRRKLVTSQFGAKLPSFANPVTDRLHASYIISGAITGRFSCKQPNLQQLPRTRAPEYRKTVVAAPGHVLIAADYDQVELRIWAWWTKCAEMTAAYAAHPKRDIHRETAAAIAGVPYDEVTPEQRQHAKPVNFGAIFGIGAQTLAEDARDSYGVEMTVAEADEYLKKFFEKYPARGWMDRHAEMCQDRGFIEMPSGRTVTETWLRAGEDLNYNRCCNYPIQGTAADAMLRAITLVEERLPGALVASIHDELILEVRAEDAATAARLLEEAMTAAFVATCPGAPSHGVVEVGGGPNWYATKQKPATVEPPRPLLRRPGST